MKFWVRATLGVIAGATLGVAAASLPMPWPWVIIGAGCLYATVTLVLLERDLRRARQALEQILEALEP